MKAKLISMLLAAPLTVLAQQRQEINLSDNWHFSHDKQSWQTVSVPHDWAIAGPFDKKRDRSHREEWSLGGTALDWRGTLQAHHHYPKGLSACRTAVRWSDGRTACKH